MTTPTEFCIMFAFADLKTFFVDDWKNKMSQLYYYNQGDFKNFSSVKWKEAGWNTTLEGVTQVHKFLWR